MPVRKALRKLKARLLGCFWLPCPLCGEMMAGYEKLGTVWAAEGKGECICPACTVERQIVAEPLMWRNRQVHRFVKKIKYELSSAR